jgi:phospholipid/cholesterol/gamma-HCH transport system substrate-binding protein
VITFRTKAQLTAFAVLSVLVLLYTAIAIAGVNPLRRPFTVKVQIPATGGLYVGSDVTYRGVHVGKVASVSLKRDGVEAVLHVNKGTKVPADTKAVITNLSAIGQQYVDLRPLTSSAPYLHDGSIITAGAVTLPPTAASVLADVDRLLLSISASQLNSLVTSLYDTFNGLAPTLRQILDSTSHLVSVLNDNAPQTNQLLNKAQTVLDTQALEAGNLRSFARSLHQLSTTVKGSDRDLRSLISQGDAASQQVVKLLTSGTQRDVAVLLGNLVPTSQIVTLRLPALKQLVISLPLGLDALSAAAPKDTLLLTLTPNGSPSCPYGTPQRSPRDAAPLPPPLTGACHTTGPNEQQRGSQNVPRPGAAGSSAALLSSYDPASHTMASVGGSTIALGSSGGQSALLGSSSWVFLLLEGAR